MSVDRSKRVKNMFASPKTANSVNSDPATAVAVVAPAAATAPEETPLKEDEIKEILIEVIEEKIDDIIQPEDSITNNEVLADLPLIEALPKPPIKQKNKKIIDKSTPPKSDVIIKEKASEASDYKAPKVYIGCRVSPEMKNELEDMAKDFAYLARKEYGLKIKDDSSSIQRAFLILGMSCFTEMVRHKILKEYDNESLMQDEVLQQLLALMKIHNVDINDIDI